MSVYVCILLICVSFCEYMYICMHLFMFVRVYVCVYVCFSVSVCV